MNKTVMKWNDIMKIKNGKNADEFDVFKDLNKLIKLKCIIERLLNAWFDSLFLRDFLALTLLSHIAHKAKPWATEKTSFVTSNNSSFQSSHQYIDTWTVVIEKLNA